MQYSRRLLPSALLFFGCLPAYTQAVLSVRSGLVNYFEGSVFLDNQALADKFGTFPTIKEGSTLRTEKGRAEILLTPGVFLRLDEDSGVRMLSTSLSDTQAELTCGSAILDSLEASSDAPVLVSFKGARVRFSKKGVYRFDSEPASVLHVYKGEAEIEQEGKKTTLDTSHLYFFAAASTTTKFGEDTDDEFSRWAEDRSGAVSAENQLSADTARDPADSDGNEGLPIDPGLVFGPPIYGGSPRIYAPPTYGGIPGIYAGPNYGVVPGFSAYGAINPFYPANPGVWGVFPVYPLYLTRYRNPAYPRQPNRDHSPTSGAVWNRPANGLATMPPSHVPNVGTWTNPWRNRPGYPHVPISATGFSRPPVTFPSTFAPHPAPIRIAPPVQSHPVPGPSPRLSTAPIGAHHIAAGHR